MRLGAGLMGAKEWLDMPKMKTNSRAKKTFRATGGGKLIHGAANNGHFKVKKSGSRKRRLSKGSAVGKSDSRLVRTMVPYL
ncbi:MAG TPA: 50S ribosomal protein L35 [Armatimonadota bacterium]|nr:50S ribosomal protein L35 [Armatimonadota bacterium]